jgi:hypothetical protein
MIGADTGLLAEGRLGARILDELPALPPARRVAVAGYLVAFVGILLELPVLPVFGLPDAAVRALHYTTIGLLVVSAPFALGGTFAQMRQDARNRAGGHDSAGQDAAPDDQ